jgi:hypothetical protein
MDGDPDPILWILSSGVHWIIAAICVSYVLLVSNQQEWEHTENDYERTHSSVSSASSTTQKGITNINNNNNNKEGVNDKRK